MEVEYKLRRQSAYWRFYTRSRLSTGHGRQFRYAFIEEDNDSYRWSTISESANTTQNGVSALAKNLQLFSYGNEMLFGQGYISDHCFAKFFIAGIKQGGQLLSTYATVYVARQNLHTNKLRGSSVSSMQIDDWESLNTSNTMVIFNSVGIAIHACVFPIYFSALSILP